MFDGSVEILTCTSDFTLQSSDDNIYLDFLIDLLLKDALLQNTIWSFKFLTS